MMMPRKYTTPFGFRSVSFLGVRLWHGDIIGYGAAITISNHRVVWDDLGLRIVPKIRWSF